jgi:hypothetical protein
MLRQPRQGVLRDRPGDFEIDILRREIEAFRARDLVIVGLGDVSQETSQGGPFHV